MSKKLKLLARVQRRPRDFTWDEACSLLSACGFTRLNGSGSGRMFVHVVTRVKLRLHEPHPQKTLLRYMIDQILEALENAGEIEKP